MEATRGNGYAPAWGLLVMMMMNHPYLEQPHTTGQNSSYPHGTSPCTSPTYTNRHHGVFLKQTFLQPYCPTNSIKAL